MGYMANKGTDLEGLVRRIEELVAPAGLTVTSNDRLYEGGMQLAEFDVQVKGRVGTADFAWLIECRDRPSQGPAPSEWIQQLDGRRNLFNFHKITAVSTSGFSPAAIDAAKKLNVELRDVRDVRSEDVNNWLLATAFLFRIQYVHLTGADLVPVPGTAADRKAALREVIAHTPSNAKVLRDKNGTLVSVAEAFCGAVARLPLVYDDVIPDGARKTVTIDATYTNENDRFALVIDEDPIDIQAIRFNGEVYIRSALVPITSLKEYKRHDTDELISQSARLDFASDDNRFTVEMHSVAGTGLTHLVVQKVT